MSGARSVTGSSPASRDRRGPAAASGSTAPPGRAGSPRTPRSGGCTATRRCSSAGSRALLLQSLHPLAMAGVPDHSGFEGDPWGRLHAPLLPRRDHLRDRRRRGQDGRRGPRGARPGARHARRTAARTPRPTRTCCDGCTSRRSTASWRAHQRYGSAPARPGRARRLRRRHRPGGRGARRDRPAAQRGGAPEQLAAYRPELEGTPAARADGAVPAARPAACRCSPGRPTPCWPPPRWRSCRCGRARRCGCPTSR